MVSVRHSMRIAWRFWGIQLFLAICALLVALWCYQRAAGKEHPTLLHVDDSDGDYDDWRGPHRLPYPVWRSMQQKRGEKLTGNDFLCLFWGGYLASHGDCLIATGPEGLGLARVNAPNSQHGGYFRCVLFLTHGQVLWVAIAVSLTAGIIATIGGWSMTTLLRRLKRRQKGHCETCGYNLHGLPTNRCPECGTKFAMPAEATGDGLP